MNPLVNRACDLIQRLNELANAHDGVEEFESLCPLREQLKEKYEVISDLYAREILLRGQVPISDFEGTQKIQQKISDMAGKFSKAPSSKSLTERNRWINLMDAIEQFMKNIRLRQATDWHHFHLNLFSGPDPEEIETRLAMTSTNKRLIAEYRNLHSEFMKLKSRVPSNPEEFQKAGNLALRLYEINREFDFDVPEEVKRFFDVTMSVHGGDLTLLTNTVLVWLKKNQLLTAYVVRARRT